MKPGYGRDELSRTLRQLRVNAGLSGIEAARQAGFSQPTISRWERGLFVPSSDDVAILARVYQAPREVRDRLVQIAGDLRDEFSSARVVLHRGAGATQRRIGRIEATSERVATFQPVMVPGLLQTAAYARAVFRQAISGAALDDVVSARLDRQKLLTESSRRFEQVLTEGALRWHAHSSRVMAEQIDHIIDIARLPGVCIGIVPWTTPVRVFPMHGFDIYDRRAVIVGTWTATALLTDQRDVRLYLHLFQEVRNLAVFGTDAIEILTRIAGDYRMIQR